MRIRTLLLLCFILSLILLTSQKAIGLTTEEKIDKLLQKMTIEEKIGQMHQLHHGANDVPTSLAEQVRKGSVGSFLNVTDVNVHNKLQKTAVEETRLGIPLIFGFDVIHGYRTIFPIPLGQSASWDTKLVGKSASIAAKEAASVGIDWTFAPMVDIARDPRWGRIAECFGEDPYLASVMAQAKVRGFQGKSLASPDTLVACLKHYVAYGAAEGGRDYNTCEVSERTLREVYLPPFKAGVKAGAGTLMSGFNEISGISASGNRFTLTDILRGEWGFDGFVVSDWDSVKQLVNHGFAANEAQAGKQAVTAGVDMEMVSRCFTDHLPQLVKEGKVSQKVIDEAVRRILRIKFRAGLFDSPYADPNLAGSIMLHKDHLQTAREMVRESLVLLKNQGSILPLKKDIKSIAVIGPLADNRASLLGTWCGKGDANDVVTVLEGIKKKVSSECKVSYVKGCDIKDDPSSGSTATLDAERAEAAKKSIEEIETARRKAVEIAKQSDVVILALGESEDMSGEAHSRASLDLPATAQIELVKAVQKTGKPVVVILLAGRPLSISWLKEHIPAILFAWHPGIQGGNGIADVLFGDYNPSGKLTVSFPRTVGQIPIYYNHKNTGRPPIGGVRWNSKYIDIPWTPSEGESTNWTPLFPFGHGLSYTTFEYSNLKISPAKVVSGQPISVSVEVKNTGNQAGEEVVQLYIRDLVGSATRPVKELKGFTKILLAAGQKEKVSFTLTPDQLKFYNRDMKFVVEPGEFSVWVGPSSVEGLEGSFEVVESIPVPVSVPAAQTHPTTKGA